MWSRKTSSRDWTLHAGRGSSRSSSHTCVGWIENKAAGNAQAVIAGDPAKPGLYVVLTKWIAGNHFSRPHFHPNDRFITVLKGTWWVGTGVKFDPNSTVAMPAGRRPTRVRTAPTLVSPCSPAAPR